MHQNIDVDKEAFLSCELEIVVDFIMFLMYNTNSFQHYLLYHQHIYEGAWNRAG